MFISVAQLCPTLCNPMDCSMPGFPDHHQLPEIAHTHVHQVSDTIQPSHPLSPLLLLPSIFPSIGVFSSESALCIKWPKYWSFRVFSNELNVKAKKKKKKAPTTIKKVPTVLGRFNSYCVNFKNQLK